MSDKLLQAIIPKLNRGDCRDSRWPDRDGVFWPLSPFRADQHSGSFKVGPKGYYDFATRAGGSLTKLAAELGVSIQHDDDGLTLSAYAQAKRLPPEFLRGLGLRDGTYYWQEGRRQVQAVFMPYKDEQGATVKTRVRLFLGKAAGRDDRFRWTGKGPLPLYGLWRLAQVRQAGWVLLVEGESDCHTAWLHGLPCLGVPGARNLKPEMVQALQGLRVYCWQEPDEGGAAMLAQVRDCLPQAYVLTPPEGVKDLSEAHIRGLDVPRLVEQLVAQAQPVAPAAPAAQSLADLSTWVRAQLGQHPGHTQKLQAATALVDWLLHHKRLLVDDRQDAARGGRPYLVGDDSALWPLDKDAVQTRLALHAAGLNSTEPVYDFIVEELIMAAYTRGEHTTLAHWQQAGDAVLYITCGPCALVRAQNGQLAKLPNGADGVWFAADAAYPAWEPTSPISPLALPAFRLNLVAPAEVPAYTPEVQRALLATWLAGQMSGLRPLPLLVLLGDKGGGKTRAAAAIMRMFLGPTSQVAPLSDDKRDWWASVTTRPLAAYDNVDSDVPKWFPDQLAAMVTQAVIESRKLFTDGEALTRPVTAAAILTTRTASFARPDIAERSLPLQVAEFPDARRIADSALMAEVDAKRDGLMSWAALAGAKLLADRTQAPAGLPLRFVDFAQMVWAVLHSRGEAETAPQMLRALRQAQSLAVGEADPLVEALVTHLADLTPNGPWKGSASELIKALSAAGADLPFMGGGQVIARRLREIAATLELCGLRLREIPQSAGQRTQFMLERAADTVSTVSTVLQTETMSGSDAAPITKSEAFAKTVKTVETVTCEELTASQPAQLGWCEEQVLGAVAKHRIVAPMIP